MATNSSQQKLDTSEIISDILCEFLEVAIHTILYMRDIYPAVIFDKRKKYNVPVQMSCHPQVNEYILSVLHSIKPLLKSDSIRCLALVILDKSKRPIERFVFELQPQMASNLKDDALLTRLESGLRAFLLKLNVCDAVLSTNPADCSFAIIVYTKESDARKLEPRQTSDQDFPWIVADESEVQIKGGCILPLKSYTSDYLKMQLYVEECTNKLEQQ
ncbi:Mitotic spindle assembly checkpoint protein MAD2B [Trichoplax sp. H2]|uniref:Mitotic spindle assembly checkpoint protein MAD2B n=1 Tax=Trichoplax adhaerens TaxID=10228 RepID=B3S5W0_TRIAD|nr:hypothetical protein TRIADDRAFT_59526 [Trichoplax adhaerens]EDV21985.1 hypothetical protein TRIADDRAFT_59526 [Trichoplax adhaerens]RDD38803.1 Mitotic spindle assembly checkpoint protein MAD2B [Trichoplax sp. H2]|eukprot:XP_002115622.1 hypothetical protein TRIADDRAFT_59526 [Trichoplax adhaerens]